jgi:dephospho-CoA kinase
VAGLRVGLTGGVGAGKSTVAALLAERGAAVIDADQIAREVVEPGSPGLAAVAERFGDALVRPDGSLDRPALAATVFADPAARADLEGILHPLIGARSAELMASAGPEAVVVYDVPLLVENGLGGGFDAVVVVEAPLEVRLARLADRGLPEDQARARIAAQATDEQRRAVATYLVHNGGSRDDLAREVDRLWAELTKEAG